MGIADILLLKADLPEGWIDLGVGEAHLTRKVLIDVLGKNVQLDIPFRLNSLQYPKAKGDAGLVKILQEKHNTEHIVVTNGAKQGIAAALYAMKVLRSANNIYTPTPYWLSFPTLIRQAALNFVQQPEDADAVIIAAPNNPDGALYDWQKYLHLKESGKPIIFDFAYNTPQYVKEVLTYTGDIHVYSCAKMYGLAGIRVGYAVCKDRDTCSKMEEFAEITTCGVSLLSQYLVEEIEKYFKKNPYLQESFYSICKTHLETNRKIARTIDNEILDTSLITDYGIFCLLKKGASVDKVVKNKIKLIDGSAFGVPGYLRMSLGVEPHALQEAVNRLNA